ncbi:MAG TPA: ATP-dependent Clp protease proteolytic subunit [Humisphaera sp.]|nr:ATP-dependent Clp protease proteolytic subunit [Humisphaera sp.]
MSTTRFILLVGLLMLCNRGAALAAQETPPPSAPASGTIAASNAAVIRLSGEVDDFRRDSLIRRFHQAQAAGARTIIIEIDTYGGLVTSGLDISRFLRGQTDVHTIAFVDNKAISAGALIAMACDEIIMTPGATLGDCAPIMHDNNGGLVALPPAERAKIQSPILRDFEDSAKKNGYSPAVADAMVAVEDSVYLVRDAQGHEKAVDEAEYKSLTAAGDWKPVTDIHNPVDGPDTLLTVGPDLAARLGISRGTIAHSYELASQRNFKIVADLRPGVGDNVVEAMNSYAARFILLIVFVLSLWVVLHAPGHGTAEALAILSLGLLVGIPMLTGYAQWWELALIFIGLALCAFEIFVFPGHGASLIAGLILLFFGFVFTFVPRDIGGGWFPSSPQAWHRLQNGMLVVVGSMVVSIIAAFQMRKILPSLPLFKKLILTEVSGGQLPTSAGPAHKAGDDVWPFVGSIGVVISDLHPGGVVRFPYGGDSRHASVVSSAGFIPAGARVVVEEARGNRIVVRTV